jgi:putative membrane protein
MKKSLLIFILITSFACNNTTDQEIVKVADSAISVISTPSTNNDFIAKAAEGSMAEIQLGRFASGHATDQRLKNYGYLMIEEHKRLLDQLKQLAAERNAKLPDTINTDHQQLISFLAPRGGNIFDSTYMAEVMKHQKQLSDLYGNIMKTSADSGLNRFAATTQPLIVRHLLKLVNIKDSIQIRRHK